MKQLLFIVVFTITRSFSYAQGSEEVERLVSEGIALHDKGEYDAAIKKYDAALKIDKKNFDANYEKAYTLFAADKKKECISISKDMIKDFADDPRLSMVYIQYGSALDDIGKSKEALEVYDEGMAMFPNEYLLPFNKGLTFHKLDRFDEALTLYQRSLSLKPYHSSSNYYTGMLLEKTNRIPALLAYVTFMAIEPQTKRSEEAFKGIQGIMGGNVKKEGDKTTITINIPMPDKSKGDVENDFSAVDMIFSIVATADNSKGMDSIARSPADKMSFKLQMLINSLSSGKDKGTGFYWKHYVPFFEAMKEKDHVGTLAHLMYLQSKDEENQKWLDDNSAKVDEFYDWMKSYSWK